MLLDLFIAQAHAQEAGAQQPNALMSLLPFVIIFVIFYFLMIKPQKKKMEQEQKMLSELSKGDEVYTKSGILGTITGLTDKIVTLEVSEGVKVKFLKSQVGGPSKAVLEDPKQDKK